PVVPVPIVTVVVVGVRVVVAGTLPGGVAVPEGHVPTSRRPLQRGAGVTPETRRALALPRGDDRADGGLNPLGDLGVRYSNEDSGHDHRGQDDDAHVLQRRGAPLESAPPPCGGAPTGSHDGSLRSSAA